MCDYVMRPARRQRTDGGGGCGGGNMEIPNDLLICEVLTRLPVKSLLRFRSVCRSWRDAVADPAFVRRHLELSRAATPPSTTVLAVHTRMDHDPDDRAAPEDVVSFHRVRPGQSPAAAAAAIVELMHEEAMECAGIHLFASHCDGLVAVAATRGEDLRVQPRHQGVLPPAAGRPQRPEQGDGGSRLRPLHRQVRRRQMLLPARRILPRRGHRRAAVSGVRH
nr:F-box protein At5g10340-like [Oryza sativa Japonica Group]